MEGGGWRSSTVDLGVNGASLGLFSLADWLMRKTRGEAGPKRGQ